MNTSPPKTLVGLTACYTRLQSLALPLLARPHAARDSGPTRDLVNWGTRFYTFAVLSHARELLASFLLLVREEHTPATFVVGRALFELAAHTALVQHTLSKHIRASAYSAAYKLLLRASVGREVQGQPGETTNEDAIGSQLHVLDAIRALDKLLRGKGFGEKAAQKMYGWLSGFTHPNMDAFFQYYRIHEDDRGTQVAFQPGPGTSEHAMSAPPCTVTSIALKVTLHHTIDLLTLAGDTEHVVAIRAANDALDRTHSHP